MSKMDVTIDSTNRQDVLYSNFNIICRLCLTQDAEETLRKIDQRDIILLKHIADLQISEDDELPSNVCSKCTQKINITDSFINQCKINNQLLTNMLSKEKTFKEKIQTITFNYHENTSQNIQQSNSADEQKTTPTNNRTYCQKCNLPFKNKFYLRTHYKKIIKCRPQEWKFHKCEFCPKEFIYLRDKLEHQNVHTGQTPYKCSYCQKEFKFKSKCKQHIYRHEIKLGLVENKLPYKEKRVRLKLRCLTCEKVFSSRSGFQYHKLKHDGKILRTCKSRNRKGSRKFLCNYCAKSFYMKSNLDAHLRTHTGENPFKCDHCSKEFRQKSALTRHKLCHKEKRTLFVCKICEKKFTTKAHRDIHMRIHTGEKPYKCEFCQKHFNYKTQLQIHVRIHTGETPFSCTICNKAYHDKGSLRKHQKNKSHLLIENGRILDTKQISQEKM